MDNPATDSATAPLGVEEAANVFLGVIDPPEKGKEETQEAPPESSAEPEAAQEETEQPAEDDPLVTIKIDGEERQVKMSEVLKGYQLAQASTKRFEEAAQTRKEADQKIAEADAERSKALEARNTYAQNLVRMQAMLEGALQEQQKTVNWQELLDTNPQEFLKQRHLAEQRQAALQQNVAEQARLAEAMRTEHEQSLMQTINAETSRLTELVPDWKEPTKFAAGRQAVAEYLMKSGFKPEELFMQRDAQGRITSTGITKAEAVLLAYKAMQYDNLMSKAAVATKKVATLPAKAEKPGNGETGLDRRTSAYQRLTREKSVDAAAEVFKSLL